MKNLFIFSIMMCCAVSLFAQIGQPFSKPVKNMWGQAYLVRYVPVFQDDNNALLYQKNTSPSRKEATDHLLIFDKNTLASEDIPVNIPGNYDFIMAVGNVNPIPALYLFENSKEDQLVLCADELDKTESVITIQGKPLFTMPMEKKSYPKVLSSVSPDGSKYAVTILMMSEKGFNSYFHSFYSAVFDKSGEMLWHQKVTPEFTGSDISIEDMKVNNDGTLFIPSYSMTISNKVPSEVHFHLITVDEKGTQMNSIEADFGALQRAKALVLKNGEVFVGGYYAESYRDNDNAIGSFYGSFDPEKESFTFFNHENFPDSYEENKVPAMVATVLANQQYVVTCDYLFEMENGSVVMTGEQQFLRSIVDANNQRSYIYLTKNILVNTISKDGESDFTMIQKRQGSNCAFWLDDYHDLYISYTAFPYKDKVCFVYNESRTNVPYPIKGNGSIGQTYAYRLAKDLKGVCTMLDVSDGSVGQQVLMSSEEDAQQLHRLQFVDDNTFFVTAASKEGFCLDKVELQ